jgi:cytochrome c oxidase cbb3-type subunit 1
MAPFWLWRAIGGTLMWLSHLLFAYNFYKMVYEKEEIVIPDTPIGILETRHALDQKSVTNS